MFCSNAIAAKKILPADVLALEVLPLKERALIIDDITAKRINKLLPGLMQQTEIDMWLLISREYNEDPVLKTVLPATWMSARRTTMFVFVRQRDTVKALAIAPYKVGELFEPAWDKKIQPNQWQALVELMQKYDPKTIGINQSTAWAHADGLVASDKQRLLAELPKKFERRLVSAERLAVRWLETRIAEEVELLKSMTALAHDIIAEGFSAKTIEPGRTSTDDLVWWFRDKILSLKLDTWFHPSVSIQRSDNIKFDHEDAFTNGTGSQVVQKGDLLHVDFGISYLRLNTDTQQHTYVLKEGETVAPAYLSKALKKGNQLQDIFTGNFALGKTGNAVLTQSREQAIAAGLEPTIYTHPLGYHGHGAGTTLGMWDSQGGVAGSGDYPLHLNTSYAIELNNVVYIDEWNKEIRIMLEEDAHFDETGVWYLDGRQTEFLLVE
ncbi:MAG: Xaa-Pro aminopeptidase [Arenicella sp.]|jgi:Xaa-Pro aminopeptidase